MAGTERARDLHGAPPGRKRLTRKEFLAQQPFRGRGLTELRRRVGDVVPVIEAMAARRMPVRVLEVGCGFGSALVELRRHFGDRIDLHGINKRRSHGDWPLMRRNALSRGLATPAELRRMRPPTIHVADVDDGLPFSDRSFDFVYSQVSFFYYLDKARFLEEVNRILDPAGMARLDVVRLGKYPRPYDAFFEIWDGPARVGFWRYLSRFPGLRRRHSGERSYLEMTRRPRLDLGLELRHTIQLNAICSDWAGMKSIFVVAPQRGRGRPRRPAP